MATLVSGLGALDPVTLKKWCDARGIPAESWWGRANSFVIPAGRTPGRGWALLRKRDLDRLTLTADQSLTFSGEDAAHVLTLAPVTVTRTECVTPGAEDDPDAAYLVEMADRRHHLAKIPIDRAYNVRHPDGSGYLADSLTAGVAWTWQQMVQDIATVLGIGTMTLPFTPHGTPENWDFHGGRAWDALNDILDRLCCTVAGSTTLDAFAVYRLGSAGDTPLLALEASAAFRGKVWDIYAQEPARGELPEKVRVLFRRFPAPPGGTSEYHAEDVTLAATAGVVAGTFETLHDDLSALGAIDAPTNAATLAARAAERAADWLRVQTGYRRALLRIYRDFLPDWSSVLGSSAGSVTYDDRHLMQTAVAAPAEGRECCCRCPAGAGGPLGPAPEVPGNLTLTPGDEDFLVQYDAPASGPTPDYYLIQVSESSDMSDSTYFVQATDDPYTVPDRANGVTYFVQVAAVYNGLVGTYTTQQSVTPQGTFPLCASAPNDLDFVVTSDCACIDEYAGTLSKTGDFTWIDEDSQFECDADANLFTLDCTGDVYTMEVGTTSQLTGEGTCTVTIALEMVSQTETTMTFETPGGCTACSGVMTVVVSIP